MSISNIPSSFANAVTPFNPLGKQPVGNENPEDKNSPLKAIEESPQTDQADNKKTQKDSKNITDQAIENSEGAKEDSAEGSEENSDADRKFGNSVKNSAEEKPDNASGNSAQEKSYSEEQRAAQELEEIKKLAARDREVREHERAHAAVGGQHAGAPSYTYKQGPDGVKYAIAGEVPIRMAKAHDPLLTIAKAQQVRRAALAPSDPSAQDRRVAAQAAQMELEARSELVKQTRDDALREKERMAQYAEKQQERSDARSAEQDKYSATALDQGKRMVEQFSAIAKAGEQYSSQSGDAFSEIA